MQSENYHKKEFLHLPNRSSGGRKFPLKHQGDILFPQLLIDVLLIKEVSALSTRGVLFLWGISLRAWIAAELQGHATPLISFFKCCIRNLVSFGKAADKRADLKDAGI